MASWKDAPVVGKDEAEAVVEQQQAAWETAPETTFDAPVGAEGGVAQPEDDLWGLFNRNLINALMAPVDLANVPARAIHRGIDSLFGVERAPAAQAMIDRAPSDTAKDLIGTLGTRFADDDTEAHSTAGRAVSGAGTALGALPAIMAGGAAAGAYQGPGQAYVNPVGEMLTSAMATPRTAAQTMAWEAAAGAGAPVGGEYGAELAQEHGVNEDVGRALGEVAGGFGAPALGMSGQAALGLGSTYLQNSPVVAPLAQIVRRAANPLDASFTRASAALRSRVSDPEAAAAAIDTPSITDMTPGMRTGSRALMAHERNIIQSDTSLSERFITRQRAGMDDVRAYLSGLSEGVEVKAAREMADRFVTTAQNRIDNELSAALSRAEAAAARASPKMGETPEGLSTIFMDELEGARQAARAVEREAWEMVPSDITTVPNNTFDNYDRLVAERGVEGQRSIDPYFKRIIEGEWQDNPERTVQQIQTFRSEALRTAREARARGDNLTASVANSMAEAAGKDLDAIETVSAPLAAARDISRAYHDRFTRGDIGKLLRYEDTGGLRINPEEALRRTVGTAKGERLVARAGAIEQALDGNVRGARAVEDFLLGDFQRTLRNPEGLFTPKRAETWQADRESFLQRYPGMRNIVDDAVGTAKAYSEQVGYKASQERALHEGPSATFQRSPVHEEFDAILARSDPSASMQELVSDLRSVDPSGKALLGLRQAATEYLIRRSDRNVASRGHVLRGQQFADVLTDARSREAMEVLYTPEQMQVLDSISSDLLRWDLMHNSATNDSRPIVAPDIVDVVANNLAAFVGIKAGSAASRLTGAGSIQMPARGSRIATAIVDRLNASGAEKLLRDAVENPELYKELLRGRRGPDGDFVLDDNASPMLAGWLAAASSDYFYGDKETPEDAWEDAVGTVGGVLQR